jgi:hypothetical protein
MSLVPVPSEQPGATCANCNAPLVADQRYCLSCGQPVTPVRLAFLDALTPTPPPSAPAQTGWGAPGTIEVSPAGYLPVAPQQGASAWLRRNNGLMGLLTVLVLCLLVGLLVGHWVSQGKTAAPGTQTVKIEGLAGLAGLGAAGTGTSTTGSETGTTSTSTSKSSASQEKKEAEEGEHETKAEKAPPKKPVKVKLNKLTTSTGKKHQEEINALGDQPIETG